MLAALVCLAGRVTLADVADTSVFDADASVVILHATPESYRAVARAGDSCVACGVIERS